VAQVAVQGSPPNQVEPAQTAFAFSWSPVMDDPHETGAQSSGAFTFTASHTPDVPQL